MTKRVLIFLTGFLLSVSNQAFSNDDKRAEEIKQMMWYNPTNEFKVTAIPDKWDDKSAVIIAKDITLSYRKAPLSSDLDFNRFNHYRIMLLDKASIEDYSQFTIPESGRYGNIKSTYYAGFKIIKPDGREIEIPMSDAVREEMEVNNSGYNKLKLAIPNLEEGDILDYYFGEEREITLATKYFSFDPVIFQLNGDYPIMTQRITFDVLRRCFINLKTLNGAPEFVQASDEKEDETTYTLVDEDRESIKDIRWLYPNRQIPSVKFKITYASSFAAMAPTFIGEPGVLKSEVSKEETEKLIQYMFTSGYYYGGDLTTHMKKNFKKDKDDLDKLAREAYYAYRNLYRISHVESKLLNGRETNEGSNTFKDVISLSNYYRYANIPHKVIIGIPREISSLDDLILENELMLMIEVNTKEPFYIGRFTNHSIVGEIDESLQGTTAYEADGALPNKNWDFKEVEIPVVNAATNLTSTIYEASIEDLNNDVINIKMTREAYGANRIYYQNVLMDIYDYKEEENTKVKELTEDFSDYNRSTAKKLLQKRVDYMDNRDRELNERLESVVKNDMNLETESVSNFEIHKTGRFHDTPAFEFSCDVEAKGGIKRVGKNYLINIGQFIDGQVHLTDEEKEDRKYDIYHSRARSFNYIIKLDIPEGYEVQGLDKLNVTIDNETGGFETKATVQDGKLIIESLKHYKSNFDNKENWPLMVEFLDAAYNFTQQQILLRKI